MLSAMFTGMHRHTRSSKYMDRKAMKRTVKANRPGSHGFSFTGEFTDAAEWAPVEAIGRRRCYMKATGENSAVDAVMNDSVERLPIVNRYGVRLGAALVFFVVFGVLLAGTAVMAYAQNTGVAKRLAQQAARMETLNENAATLQSEIAFRSNGVNIRQEAVRIGLKSSRGTDVVYVDVPADAVLSLGAYGTAQDMASVFGQ